MESGHQEGRQRAHCLWSVFSTPAILNTRGASPFQGGQAHFTGRAKIIGDLVAVTGAARGPARMQI